MKRRFLKLTALILVMLFATGSLSACMGAGKVDLTKIYKDVYRSEGLGIESGEDFVSLYNADQKVSFKKNAEGGYAVYTYIMKDGNWTAMFDAGRPLVEGKTFGSYPTSYEITEDTKSKKQIKLTGRNEEYSYNFDIVVTAKADSGLINFVITNHIEKTLLFGENSPVSMLWMNSEPADMVSTWQETPCYQWLGDEKWNSCFPYSYIWTNGMEAGIFFNMEPMDWFSFKNGLERFRKVQVRTSQRNGQTGIGMDVRHSQTAKRVVEGDMVFDFSLYGKANGTAPTRMQALSKAVSVFAECFPDEIDHWPENFYEDAEIDYTYFVSNIPDALMMQNKTYGNSKWYRIHNQLPATFKDEPAFAEYTVDKVWRRPDYALNSSLDKNMRRTQVGIGTWHTTNNAVVPWIALNRINPREDSTEHLAVAYKALTTFYDPVSRIIRDFDSALNYRGNEGGHFSFQFFMMSFETLKAGYFSDPAVFDPTIMGKYLQGMDGILELAQVNDYILPQLLAGGSKTALNPVDHQDFELGKPIDVWTLALYAYDMCLAHQFTGTQWYLDEAIKAANYLFTEGLTIPYENETFSTVYTDVYDFPFNVESSSAYGVAASQYLYKVTGEDKYLNLSDDYKNLTLRMMHWYESNLRDNELDCLVNVAGLFNPMPSGNSPTSWENIHTYMAFLPELANEDIIQSKLLMDMYNQFRVSNMFFMGYTWDPELVRSAELFMETEARGLATEDFYTPEQGTTAGNSGPCVYMSNDPIYAYLMFEGYLKAESKDILAVNTDVTLNSQDMANAANRNFVVYNPTDNKERVKFTMGGLEEDVKYTVTVKNSSGKKIKSFTKSGKSLTNGGFALSVAGGDYVRINLTYKDKEKMAQYELMKKTQSLLTQSYYYIQTKATADGKEWKAAVSEYKENYLAALEKYNEGNYQEAYDMISSKFDALKALCPEKPVFETEPTA